jgi:hypothetical protein
MGRIKVDGLGNEQKVPGGARFSLFQVIAGLTGEMCTGLVPKDLSTESSLGTGIAF